MSTERARLLVTDGAGVRGVDVEGATTTTTTTTTTSGMSGHSWQRRRRTALLLAIASLLVGALACASDVLAAFGLVSTQREFGPGLNKLEWNPKVGFKYSPRKTMSNRFRGIATARLIEQTITRYYPSRITPKSKPFSVNFLVDDCPHTKCSNKMFRRSCHVNAWEPIFAFGSSPKDPTIFPTMHSATLLTLKDCFNPSQTLGNTSFVVTEDMEPTCRFLQYPKTVDNMPNCDATAKGSATSGACRYYGLFNLDAMPNKEEYEWDNLITKGIWRGSDYPYLTGSWSHSKHDGAQFVARIAASHRRGPDHVNATMEAMLKSGAMGPRMRAVVMSRLHPETLDAKFFNWGQHHRGGPRELVDVKHIELDGFAKYKYQLDLGGGGGTTWSGVLPKLSMPGVLFHHETPMKDSYFDLLKPYVHYLPLDENLKNYDTLVTWVESHPEEAKKIAETSSEWIREFRKPANLLRHNYEVLVKPLAKALDPSGKLQPVPFEKAHHGLKP